MTWWDAAFLAAAGVVGGLTGSVAGLASIATYPALLVVGLPPIIEGSRAPSCSSSSGSC